MKTKVNRQLLTQKTFDSGALGMMASVVHQFHRPGRYLGLVRKDGETIGSFTFAVAEAAEEMQLNIDLATVTKKYQHLNETDDCQCCEKVKLRVISSKGYVLFFASAGEGYSVVVGQSESDTVEFDSSYLDNGDLFALTLLEPTHYSIVNSENRAHGEIDVSFSPEDSKQIKNLETIYVNVEKSVLNPARIKLVSTQGLVFRVSEKSRLIIEKTGSANVSEAKNASLHRWSKVQ